MSTNTPGLCNSLKSVQFRLFHPSKSSLSKRSRFACSSGVCATTTAVAVVSAWLEDDDNDNGSSCAIAVKLLKSNPIGLATRTNSNSNENTTTTTIVRPFPLSMVAFDNFDQRQSYPQLYL